ncbi:MAG: hypothetical protein ACXWZZ_04035 [Solirubrobacteraceae bacterium]
MPPRSASAYAHPSHAAGAARELSATRLLSCSDPERARVAAVVGRPVSAAEIRTAVEAAATRGAREGRATARALRATPRTAPTSRLFESIFNVPPAFVPPWRPANASWRDLGDLVALRLERASGILVGGHVRLFCWGSAAHCPECTGDPTRYRACSSYRGRYHICIGGPWWAWFKQGRRGLMASTLLHEALHVYFVLEHHKAAIGRPSVNNVYCYDTLVALQHGCAPKPGDRDKCRLGPRP